MACVYLTSWTRRILTLFLILLQMSGAKAKRRQLIWGLPMLFQQLEDRKERAPIHYLQHNIKVLTLDLFLPQNTFPGMQFLQAWLVPVKKSALSIAASTYVIFCKKQEELNNNSIHPFQSYIPRRYSTHTWLSSIQSWYSSPTYCPPSPFKENFFHFWKYLPWHLREPFAFLKWSTYLTL